jgi:arylsulfatase A-like enzyme
MKPWKIDRRGQVVPIVLILVGAIITAFALGIDLLQVGRQSGLGARQIVLATGGMLLFLTGGFLASPFGRRFIHNLSSPAEEMKRPISIFLVAIWFGLLTGFGEVIILVLRKLLLNKIILRSIHFPWMLPVGETLIFMGLAVLLFFIWRRQKASGVVVTVFLFTMLASVSWLFLLPRVKDYAALILSIGLAVQTARLTSRYTAGFYWLIHRTTPGLIALLALVAAGSYGRQALAERRSLAQLPPIRADAPNILLIALDTVRAQNLGLYGYHRASSPFLDGLAQEAVSFERAFSTAPWTLPSHASMFTGRWHHELSVQWQRPLDQKYPTLAEALSEQGYYTAGFVANTLNCGYEFGLNRGFAHYEDYRISPAQILASTSLVRYGEAKFKRFIGPNRMLLPKTARIVNDSFLRWLTHHTDRPFFVFLNYMDAHEPYQPPKPFRNRFGSPEQRSNPYVVPFRDWSPEEIQAEIDAYDGAIAYLDAQLERLFVSLEQNGSLQNTLVIITSDHGEEFGEHQVFGHGNSLYSQAIHVPLVIFHPAKTPQGMTIPEAVSLRDLPATVLDLIEAPDRFKFPGKSLARHWQAETAQASPEGSMILAEVFSQPENNPIWFPTSKGNIKSLISGSYHYIVNGDGREELYLYSEDLEEQNELATAPGVEPIMERFRNEYQTSFPSKQSLITGFNRISN